MPDRADVAESQYEDNMKTDVAFASQTLFPEAIASTQVLCLRCERRLERYCLTGSTPLARGAESGHAMLVCPNCGHIEFVSAKSPLLDVLEISYVDTGDGD